MNRRALFGMILGTLAVGHLVSLEDWEDWVDLQDARAALNAVENRGEPISWQDVKAELGLDHPPVAELFVSVSQDVSEALSGLTRLDATAYRFGRSAPAALLLESGAVAVGAGLFDARRVCTGPIMVCSEAEAADFVQRVAEVIRRAPAA